ncbi:hypothetical protein [Massilia horti]|uniref:Uncharacterized protein n=1 Tax=Massilia horti TaxID=2562153 RepID=A0A4Y9T553_9BURK|nr:hypothetical protein [Massilia horti]TFW32926.1 hypothetical protein E4O92_08355 [Massilia horti]
MKLVLDTRFTFIAGSAVGLLFGNSLSVAIIMVPYVLLLVLLYAGAAFLGWQAWRDTLASHNQPFNMDALKRAG